MVSFKGAAALGLALLTHLPQFLAMPASLNEDGLAGPTSLNYNNALLGRQDEGADENPDDNPDEGTNEDADEDPEKKPFWLRIMPLGASITAGRPWPPEDDSKNGYRKFLRDQLRSEGWEVNMVGNFNLGTMNDNDHEGVPGDLVSDVRARAKESCHYWLPNVVLINAGTNDANKDTEDNPISGIKGRMQAMIDDIFAEVPKAVVVLSTLLPTDNNQDGVDDINNQYRQLAEEYNQAHRNEEPEFKVILADMADGIISIDDIHDGTHPNVLGQKKMAAVWDWAIGQAWEKGWLSEPSDSGKFSDGDGSTNCKKEYGSGDDDPRAGRQVLYGSADFIKGDGTYKHDSTHRTDSGGKWEGDYNEMRMFFAQLVNLEDVPKGGERDEAIFVTANGDRRSMWYELNNGDGTFDSTKHKINVHDDCNTENMHWGDVNGDGLDDFICLDKDGEMFVSINEGGNPATFKSIGSYKKPERGLGRRNVRLGDIDGDGRLDYCVIEGNGDIYCWRNGGLGQKAEYWQDMGKGKPIFTGKDMGDIKGVRFVDINGDGRDDWLWMDERGKTTTYINQRGDSKTLIPKWLEAGVTHAGMDKQKNMIEDDNSDRHRIQFARLYEDEKTDYVYYVIGEHAAEDLTSHAYWDVWQNKGSGGRYQPGDGIYFGDTTGTGVDDYIWISPEGRVHVFPNKNTVNETDYYETGAWSANYQLDTKLSRRALHVGDWDGDGKADIIGVTNRKTGALRVWLSQWDGDELTWGSGEDVADSAKCNQGWGRLYFDHGAHFADITGSGRVDYLCMERDGRTTAWLRDEDGKWSDAGQVKFSEDLDRANYRFADADGDGKADLIWTDKFTGDGKVWYNLGQKTEGDRGDLGGSLFEWAPGETVYQGSSRGPNMHFPNLGGQGRADMVGTNPSSGEGWVWFNSCPAGGDDGPIEDPGLPEYEPNPIDTGPGDPEDHWFCGAQNAAIWTMDLWDDHNMGEWLLRRSQLYSGRDAEWPSDPKNDIEGVPRVIAQYNGLQKDDAFNWGGECISISGTCELDANDLLKDDVCTKFPERAFSLWAMRNLARFMQRWLDLLTDGALTASLWTADIARTFVVHTPEELTTDAASFLTIMSGLLTTVGALAPELGKPIFSTVGILGVGNGLSGMGMEATTKDVRFDDFADLSTHLGEMVLAMDDAMTKFFNQLFVETPPNEDEARGTQLAKILEDGMFASQDVGTGKDEVTKGDMVRLIRASIISEAWNMEDVAIVKWGKDSDFVEMSGFNPCEEGGKKWGMDHAIACPFDKNHIIVSLIDSDATGVENGFRKGVPKIGQDEDTLDKYDLNHEIIIRAAERTQSRAKEFRPRNLESVGERFNDIVDNPSGNLGQDLRDDLVYFNIPVCDLDELELEGWCEYTVEFQDDMKACVVDFVSRNCVKMRIGGAEWPYEFEATHRHGGPWDD